MSHYLKEELYNLIKKDESIFDFIQEGSLDGLWYWDLEKPENEWMNARFWKVLGYNPEEMPHLASAWQDIINKDDLKIAFENVKKHMENPEHFYDQEVRYTHKDGSTVWIRCRGLAIRDSNGKPIRMLGAHHDVTAIKNKEEETSLLAEMLDIAPNSITVHDDTGKFLFANQKTFEIHGYSREEFMELNLYTLDVPSSSELIEDRIKAIRENKQAKFEVEHFKKDGTKIPLEVSVKLVDWKGSPAMLSIATDISERKQMLHDLLIAKKATEQSNQFYKVTFEEAAVGIAHVYSSGKLFRVNNKFCEITGYSTDELININFADITYPDDLERENVYIQKVLANEINSFTIEKRYRHKKGDYIWVILYSNVIRDKNGNIKFAICTISDITVRKNLHFELLKSKEKLEESEAKLKLALKVARIGYWRYMISTNKVDWSDGHETLFGIPMEQFKNTLGSVQSFVHPEDRANGEENLKNAISNDIPFDNTYRVIYPNNEIHWLHSIGILVKNSENIKTHLFGVTQDITEQINREIELKDSKEKAEESDRLKTAFLQNLSHEIRTPLNAICGFSGMLNKPQLSSEKRTSFVSIIQNNSNQLLSIISDILTISSLETRQEKLNIDKVCINNIIVDLLAIFKQQTVNQNISLYSKQPLSNRQSEIYTDKTKITQILSNLISNALKFTHEGFIEFGYSLKNDIEPAEMEFYVKDSGIGIEPELHEKIFERFRQADLSVNKKYGGTGLGLAISRGFAELLGGKIWVESQIDKGSTFYFTLPYKPVNEIDNVAAIKISDKYFTKPTILVAEDEEFNYLYIEELLIENDYKLIHAKDGQETVELFKKNPDISLILMDIKMPIMDGHTAAEIIKELKPGFPIIAQSAYALEHERAKYEGVFDDYLTKPINENDLKQILMKYIDINEA